MEISLTAPTKQYLAPRVWGVLFCSLLGMLWIHEWIMQDPKVVAMDTRSWATLMALGWFLLSVYSFILSWNVTFPLMRLLVPIFAPEFIHPIAFNRVHGYVRRYQDGSINLDELLTGTLRSKVPFEREASARYFSFMGVNQAVLALALGNEGDEHIRIHLERTYRQGLWVGIYALSACVTVLVLLGILQGFGFIHTLWAPWAGVLIKKHLDH